MRLNIPAYVTTGFCEREHYLSQIQSLERVMDRFPELSVIVCHFGGNLVHPTHPDYTDTPEELHGLLETGRFYLEVGYVLAYENVEVWGSDSRYPYPRQTSMMRRVYDRYGAGVLVWGSDVPWCYRACTYQQCLDSVREHSPFVSSDEMDAVLGGNMARLLKLAE